MLLLYSTVLKKSRKSMLFLPPPLFHYFHFLCLLFIYILQIRQQTYLDKLNEITNKIKIKEMSIVLIYFLKFICPILKLPISLIEGPHTHFFILDFFFKKRNHNNILYQIWGICLGRGFIYLLVLQNCVIHKYTHIRNILLKLFYTNCSTRIDMIILF